MYDSLVPTNNLNNIVTSNISLIIEIGKMKIKAQEIINEANKIENEFQIAMRNIDNKNNKFNSIYKKAEKALESLYPQIKFFFEKIISLDVDTNNIEAVKEHANLLDKLMELNQKVDNKIIALLKYS